MAGRATENLPGGSLKYQFVYLKIRIFKCGYRYKWWNWMAGKKHMVSKQQQRKYRLSLNRWYTLLNNYISKIMWRKNMIYHDLLIVWWHCLDIKTWASCHPIALPAILERVWRPQRRWGIGNVWGNTLAMTRRFRLDRFCFFFGK